MFPALTRLSFTLDCRKHPLLQHGDFACVVHDRQFIGKAFFFSHRNNALLVFFLGLIHYLDRCFTLHLIVTTRTLGQTSAVRVRIITFFRDGGTTPGGRRRKGKRSFQNRCPSVCEDQRQLVGEVFFLSLDDCAIVFLLGGARYGLHRLPRSQVSLFSGTEDPVQHSTYRQQADVTRMQGSQWASGDACWLRKQDSTRLPIGCRPRK